MAIDARYWVVACELLCLEVRHGVQLLEPPDEVATAGPLVRDVHGGMAVEAGAGLCGHPLALGEDLVAQHVRVAPLLPEVLSEGIAGPHLHQPRILLQAALGDHLPRVDRRGGPWRRLAAAVAGVDHVHRLSVVVVLLGKVPTPHRGVHCRVRQLDDAVERVPRLLLSLDDCRQECRDAQRHDGCGNRGQHDPAWLSHRTRCPT